MFIIRFNILWCVIIWLTVIHVLHQTNHLRLPPALILTYVPTFSFMISLLKTSLKVTLHRVMTCSQLFVCVRFKNDFPIWPISFRHIVNLLMSNYVCRIICSVRWMTRCWRGWRRRWRWLQTSSRSRCSRSATTASRLSPPICTPHMIWEVTWQLPPLNHSFLSQVW